MVKPPDILYHYTTQNGLLSILKDRKIWTTNILFFNDSKEFNHTIELALDFLDRSEGIIEKDLHKTVDHLFSDPQAPDVYVTSLSAMKDQLSQWRAYCPNLGGFNIGFDTEELVELGKAQGFVLLPCNYDLQQQKEIIRNSISITCDSFNQQLASNPRPEGEFDLDSFLKLAGETRINYALQLLLIAPYFKHPKFEEEKEWRFIFYQKKPNEKEVCFREGASMVLPYVEFELSAASDNPLPIKEIIIGPTPHKDLSKKSVEKLVIKHGIQSCDVVLSDIPYRAW